MGKESRVWIKQDQYKNNATTKTGANVDAAVFNMGLIMETHPEIGKKLMAIYNELPNDKE